MQVSSCFFFLKKPIDFLDYRDYTKRNNLDIRDYDISKNVRDKKGGMRLPREKLETLTPQMFYVLLCLTRERCGTDILDCMQTLTGGRVTIGSGTLYTLLEQFCQAGLIFQTRTDGRRRSYLLTQKGRARLDMEYARILAQAQDYRRMLAQEDDE